MANRFPESSAEGSSPSSRPLTLYLARRGRWLDDEERAPPDERLGWRTAVAVSTVLPLWASSGACQRGWLGSQRESQGFGVAAEQNRTWRSSLLSPTG